MSKKKMTDDQKMAAFEQWKGTEEYKTAMSFCETRTKLLEGGAKLEIASRDITYDMQAYLDQAHHLMTVFKVKPKAKAFEQRFVRTMFFEFL